MFEVNTSNWSYGQHRKFMAYLELDQSLRIAARDRMAGAGSSDFRELVEETVRQNTIAAARELFGLGCANGETFGSFLDKINAEFSQRWEMLDKLQRDNREQRRQLDQVR
jgi:hypothetical protein